MSKQAFILTPSLITTFAAHLREQERSEATIQKYPRDLTALCSYLEGAAITKTALLAWKDGLIQTHAPSSVNSMLAALNSFLGFVGFGELAVKQLKIQKPLFLDEGKELTRAEYTRLVQAAKRQENERLSLILQTICAACLPAPITRWSVTCRDWRISSAILT